MLKLMPRTLPTLHAMLKDIGSPGAVVLGKALCVHPRTVQRWLAAGAAPHPVMLALFWLTRWGQSILECEALNETNLRLAIARNLADENAKLAGQINHLSGIADFGSANDPVPDAVATDPTRLALKAFLDAPANSGPTDANEDGQPGTSTASATTEESQHLRGLRHG